MSVNMSPFTSNCIDNEQYHSSNIWNILTSKLRFSSTITILVYIIYLLPFCFGVFGNLSVCLIFFQQRKLRSITNTFLMNLCLNDLIVLCVSIPMTLSAALFENWVFGPFLCKFVSFTPTLTALVSTFTVAVIAVERWFFIVNKQKFDRHCTIFTLICLWFISILIALPDFFSRQVQEFNPQQILPDIMKGHPDYQQRISNETVLPKILLPCNIKKTSYCVVTPDLRMRIFSYIVITVQYLVPFLFVSISCYSISRFLKRRMIRMRVYQNHRLTNSTQQKKSTTTIDEITEQELTSNDDAPTNSHLSSTSSSNNHRSKWFFARVRQTLQNLESVPFQYSDQQQYLKSQSHATRRFHRSRKLLICIAALFTISWLPLTITQIYLEHNADLYYGDQANFIYGFLLIPCYLISSLSAWINPIIYNYINRSFRREFYALYSCCLKSSTRGTSTSPSTRNGIVTIGSRKRRRETDDLDTCFERRSTGKQIGQVVSFAEDTTIMLHD